jgi:hypothetical protein
MEILTLEEAAKKLRWGKRKLQHFLAIHPTDDRGVPFYFANGNRKLLAEKDLDRIVDFLRAELAEQLRPRA